MQEVAKTTQGNTTTISQVSQKADKISTTLSQKIDGKADVSRVSSLEENPSGFKTTVAQSYQPKGDYPTRSDMQSSISQTASSIKSEVANTYTTQTATEALRKSATRTFTMGGAAGKAKWVKLGDLTSRRRLIIGAHPRVLGQRGGTATPTRTPSSRSSSRTDRKPQHPPMARSA